MEYVDPDTLLKALEDLNKQILELRSEISYIKGYITSMNIHPYVPPYTPPYREPYWPNQVWMSTDNHQPKSVPCQAGDSNARS